MRYTAAVEFGYTSLDKDLYAFACIDVTEWGNDDDTLWVKSMSPFDLKVDGSSDTVTGIEKVILYADFKTCSDQISTDFSGANSCATDMTKLLPQDDIHPSCASEF